MGWNDDPIVLLLYEHSIIHTFFGLGFAFSHSASPVSYCTDTHSLNVLFVSCTYTGKTLIELSILVFVNAHLDREESWYPSLCLP